MAELKELLGEELAEQVNEQLDDDIELFVAGENDGDYIPRDTFNERIQTKTDKIEMLESQLEERDNQIEQLKEDTNATEELQNKIEELQEKNKKTEQELQQQLQQQRLESEVEKALLKNNARNPQAVKALLDDESIELTDDGVKGLDEQLENLQETDGYLFEDDSGGSKAGDDFKGDSGTGQLTESEIDNMTEEEINENWEEVQKVLENT